MNQAVADQTRVPIMPPKDRPRLLLMLSALAQKDDGWRRKFWIPLIFQDNRVFAVFLFEFLIIGEPAFWGCEPESSRDQVSERTGSDCDQSRQNGAIEKSKRQMHEGKTPQPHPKRRAEDSRYAGHPERRRNQKCRPVATQTGFARRAAPLWPFPFSLI